MIVRIIGLDPGTENTGYAVLHGVTAAQEVELSDYGVMKTKKDTDGEVRDRIDILGDGLRKLAERWVPTDIAIEDFTEQGRVVGKTYKEMSWLTEHFRMVSRERGLEAAVYENQFWKHTLMRARRATKEQVQHYVAHRIPMARVFLKGAPTHIWDAVAIALCRFDLVYGAKK